MYLSEYGILGKMLFEERPAWELVKQLIVPIRPQNLSPVDNVTPTTTQAPSDCLAGDSADRRQAAREAAADSQRQRKMADINAGSVATSNGSSVSFRDLPVELHRLIFGYLDIVDVLRLGVLTKYFWSIARDFVHDYFMAFLGNWAGKNIVCVGYEVEPGDYPPGLFTPDELKELNKRYIRRGDHDSGWSELLHFTLADFSSSRVSRMVKRFNMDSESLMLIGEAWSGYQRPNNHPPLWDMPAGTGVESMYAPTDQVWVLRNLSTKEFVRSEAIALKPEFIHGAHILGIGFGEVVMSRICWTTNPSTSLNQSIDISRGVWAGHCFDITTLARCEEEIKGAEWRDVSEEVSKEIAAIWESEYGPGWREAVCKSCERYDWFCGSDSWAKKYPEKDPSNPVIYGMHLEPGPEGVR